MRVVMHWVRRVLGRATQRWVAVVVVALVGAWLGMVVGGSVTAPVGPVDAKLSVSPSLTGNTFVDVAPLGKLELDTTDSPVALNASVAQIRLDAAKEIIHDPNSLAGIEDRIANDLEHAVVLLVAKSVGCGLLGALVLTTVVFRNWRRVLAGSGIALAAFAVVGGVAAATWNPKAVEQPKYSGILASAPSLVGSAETIASDFGKYRVQLAKLVTNLTKLYDATSDLPLTEPDPSTMRVLHVSDIHNNPAAYNVIQSVQKQFKASMIIDTGDSTDQGTRAENRTIEQIGRLKVPYVWVKGNHDSKYTVDAVKRQPNAVVLDGSPKTVQGIRMWGIGDPRFQPDEVLHTLTPENQLTSYGQRLRPRIAAADDLDMTLTHDPTIAKQWNGLAPLSLAGHIHKRSNKMLPGGTRAMTVGSTGGSGLRAVKNKEPYPIEINVLYLDKETHRLQAWDEITLGGVGRTSAELERFTDNNPDRDLNPQAGQSPTPIPTPSGSGTNTPYTVPPSTPATGTPSPSTGGRRRRR